MQPAQIQVSLEILYGLKDFVLSSGEMLVENETVHHCDINKMKKKHLVPFRGFVEHIIIPNQGIRQVHTSHVCFSPSLPLESGFCSFPNRHLDF